MASAGMISPRHFTKVSDAPDFFKATARTLEWGDLADQLVMDLGCGTGSSSKCFAIIFPKVEKIIAVDVLPNRLVKAQKQNPHPLVDYQRADISNKFTLARWTREMDKVVSVFSFNYLLDQKEAYENVYSVLKPGGEAAILQSLRSKFYDVLKELAENPKWTPYAKEIELEIPESHFEKFTIDYYKQLFDEMGFEVIQCNEKKTSITYASDTECKEAIFLRCPIRFVVPEELRAELKEDVFESFLNHITRNEENLLCITYCTLSTLLRKPTNEDYGDYEDYDDSD